MARSLVTKGRKIQADAEGNLPGTIELLHTGTWKAPWHGEWETTPADIAEYVRNFENGVGLVEADKRAPIKFDHPQGKAGAWITRLSASEDGSRLLADVDWTPAGRKALIDDEYAYISAEFNPRAYPWEDPEEENHFAVNVVTAAALTNEPLHKRLKPVMASAKPPVKADANKPNKGDPMDLQEILAKKADERTDEEKAFVADHAAELTVEQRAENDLETADEKTAREEKEAQDTKAAKDKADKEEEERIKASNATTTISASRLAKLEADAKAGLEASKALAKKEAEDIVDRHISAGRVKSDQRKASVDMLLASTGDARKGLETFMDALPENKLLASEVGSGASRDEVAEVSDQEKALAASFGNSPEELAEFKKAQS